MNKHYGITQQHIGNYREAFQDMLEVEPSAARSFFGYCMRQMEQTYKARKAMYSNTK